MRNEIFFVVLYCLRYQSLINIEKPDQKYSVIHADRESLILKKDGYRNNSEKSSPTKVVDYINCGYSISTTWILDGGLHEKALLIFRRERNRDN